MTLRRLEWLPFVLGGLALAGYIGGMAHNWPVPLLRLRHGRRIRIRVWEPSMQRAIARSPARHATHTQAIAQLLTDVPAVASVGDVERHWGYGHLALALAPFVVFGITAAVLLQRR